MLLWTTALCCIAAALAACPDRLPGLKDWVLDGNVRDVVVGSGQLLRIIKSGEVRSLTIENGGKVVWASGEDITLKTRRIHIKDGGELHIGAADCLYTGRAAIVLKGRSNEDSDHPDFGKKFIGVAKGGVLELHGQKKLSWTQLTKTLTPGGGGGGGVGSTGGSLAVDEIYDSKNLRGRGIHAVQLNGESGAFIEEETFDTHGSSDSSAALTAYLQKVPKSRILVLLTNDAAYAKLTSAARTEIKRLGGKLIDNMRHRDPYVFIAKTGSPTLTKENLAKYTGAKKAEAQLTVDFKTSKGSIRVTGLSTWAQASRYVSQVKVSATGSAAPVTTTTNGRILTLKDTVTSWKAGDTIVVASTDYDMNQAEEFKLVPCSECQANQVKISGAVKHMHFGEIDRGVDMRAEVGLLTRNIQISAEMQSSCYGDNQCKWFKQDTFGGHIKIVRGFKSVHIEGVEMTKLGQQKLGFYPVHFHMAGDVDSKGGYSSPTYVKDVSIHHCFSRCVTIHGTHGLLVQDTVGYDTLGHCYFLEDGAERRNTLKHNLGLVTRFGTVLPSDRSTDMCRGILDKVWKGYKPSKKDCEGLSTFWISHPDNNIIDNAAAGSAFRGMWYMFHECPTGASTKTLPCKHAQYSPMGTNSGNTVHSNEEDGFHLDGGVKISPASAKSPQEFLSVDVGVRYKPHQNQDKKKPRVAAKIEGFTAYKNGNRGAWVRGGEIHFSKSGFADNGMGVTLASEGLFPNDPGSRQEVTDSIFIGESRNRGNPSRRWYRGADGKMRSFPKAHNFPMRGVGVYDGPNIFKNIKFYSYHKTKDYTASAISFKISNQWQMATTSSIQGATFDSKTNRFYAGVEDNPYKDGDKLVTVWDKDGTVTGTRGTHVARPDNALMMHSGCRTRKDWKMAICTGDYATLYIRINGVSRAKVRIHPDHTPSTSLTLRGTGYDKNQGKNTYIPNMLLRESYTLHWLESTPSEILIYPANFNKGDWLRLGMCLPGGAKLLEVRFYLNKKATTLPKMGSATELDRRAGGGYYHDTSIGMLFLRVEAKQARPGYYYCASATCDYIKIRTDKKTSTSSDCAAKAYPKYQVKEPARKALSGNWATVG